MKVKDTQPVISSFIVIIEDLKYEDTLCTVEVECLSVNQDDENPIFHTTNASCDEPFFIIGKSFWKEEFGIKQTNRIEKLCNEAIANYLEKENE